MGRWAPLACFRPRAASWDGDKRCSTQAYTAAQRASVDARASMDLGPLPERIGKLLEPVEPRVADSAVTGRLPSATSRGRELYESEWGVWERVSALAERPSLGCGCCPREGEAVPEPCHMHCHVTCAAALPLPCVLHACGSMGTRGGVHGDTGSRRALYLKGASIGARHG